jgi:uncharacterized protein (DUF1501 family)
MPRTLKGAAPAIAMGAISEFDLRAGRASRRWKAGFDKIYSLPAEGFLGDVGTETLAAVEFLRKRNPSRYQTRSGVSYPRNALGNSLRQIAQLIKADVGLEVAFAESGGWDHHANEGGAEGPLAQRLTELAQSLNAFYRDMEDHMNDIVILTMSEFGRTAHENGNYGTDHGHANVMFLLGGAVKGGKIYGEWPGLDSDQLYQGRDLALTTDFRDVFAEVLVRHLGLQKVGPVFPGYQIHEKRFRNILQA